MRMWRERVTRNPTPEPREEVYTLRAKIRAKPRCAEDRERGVCQVIRAMNSNPPPPQAPAVCCSAFTSCSRCRWSWRFSTEGSGISSSANVATVTYGSEPTAGHHPVHAWSWEAIHTFSIGASNGGWARERARARERERESKRAREMGPPFPPPSLLLSLSLSLFSLSRSLSDMPATLLYSNRLPDRTGVTILAPAHHTVRS